MITLKLDIHVDPENPHYLDNVLMFHSSSLSEETNAKILYEQMREAIGFKEADLIVHNESCFFCKIKEGIILKDGLDLKNDFDFYNFYSMYYHEAYNGFPLDYFNVVSFYKDNETVETHCKFHGSIEALKNLLEMFHII